MWALASCPPRSCVLSCTLPSSCFERKPTFWRIWETPLVMPLFCISPRVLGSLEGLFALLTTQRVKHLDHDPLKPTNMAKKCLIWVFFSTLSFILAKIQLRKSNTRFVPSPAHHDSLIQRRSSGISQTGAVRGVAGASHLM